jgi:endonuclease-3
MALPSRTAQFTRLHKILKKYYHPVAPDADRSVLEHLLFASLLENAHYTAAEEAFAALVHSFFDWNEIRVSSVRELSEVVGGLPEPSSASHHVKRILQSLFEATYSFDLEELRKLNLGPAVERLEKIEGTTRFAVAYVVQAALGGHSIPLDSGTLQALLLTGPIQQSDAAAGVVPGLERAIPKNIGVEFGSLLHQLGADFVASPFTPSVHAILLEINPEIKDRLPRRRDARLLAPRTSALRPESVRQEKAKKGQQHREDKEEAKTKEEPRTRARESVSEPAEPPAAKGPPAKSKEKPAAEKKKPVEATEPAQPAPQEPAAAEEPADDKGLSAGKAKPAAPKKKTFSKKPGDPAKPRSEPDAGPQDSGVEGLFKRKPR